MKLTLLALLLIFPLRASAQEYPFYSENTRTAQEWIQSMKNWKLEQQWTPPGDALNNALAEVEMDYGSDDSPKPQILLQFPGDGDYESLGW